MNLPVLSAARRNADLAALADGARSRAADPREDRASDVLEWLSSPARPRLCAAPAR